MLHLHTKKLGKVRWEFQAEPKADGGWDTPERWGKPDSGPMELEMRDHMDGGENGFNNHIFLFYFSPKLATRALSHGSHQLSYRSRSLEVSEGLSNLPRGSQRINRSCPSNCPSSVPLPKSSGKWWDKCSVSCPQLTLLRSICYILLAKLYLWSQTYSCRPKSQVHWMKSTVKKKNEQEIEYYRQGI